MSDASATSFTRKLGATLSMIKVAHTIFAMPFAIIGWAWGTATVAEAGIIDPRYSTLAIDSLPILARELGFEAAPWAWTLIWVVVAMIGARSFAMAFNRIADKRIDADNPRTAKRELPSGTLSTRFTWGFALGSAAIFVAACAMINHQTLILAPIALLIVGGYSLTKRFTAFCHLILGLGLALAPVGGWLAAVGRPWEIVSGVEWAPFGLSVFDAIADADAEHSLSAVLGVLLIPSILLLGIGVLLWVAGFDVIYSLQDESFDRQRGLHSIPAKLGSKGALALSRVLHVLGVTCWIGAVVLCEPMLSSVAGAGTSATLNDYTPEHALGYFSYVGLGVVGACLLYEHSLVKHDDLSRVDAAFFTVNGVISIVFATLITLDVFVID